MQIHEGRDQTSVLLSVTKTMAEKKKEEKKALLHDTYLYNVQQGGRFTTMEIAQKGILEWNNSHKLFVLQIYFCGTTQIMTSFFLLQSLQY